MSGEAQATVHLAFAERYGVDIVRLSCGYPFPLPKGVRFERPQDFTRVEATEAKVGGFDHSLTCLRKVASALKDRCVLETIPSAFTTLASLAGEQLVLQAMREHPGFLQPALEAVTKTYERYVKRALDAGADGVFLVVSAASHQHMSPEEYSRWSEPYDRRVLEAASVAPCNTVYAAGSRLFLDPLKALPCSLLGWSQAQAGPGLARGRSGFDGAVLGGLDELRPEDYPSLIERHAEEWTAPGLVLAPGGPLSAEIDPRRIDDLRQAVLGLAGFTRYKEAQDRPPKPKKAREPRPEPTSYPTPKTTGRARLTGAPELGAEPASTED